MMDLTGDFFIGARIPADTLRATLARVMKMDPSDVRPIEAPREDGDDRRAFIITIAENKAGDYPGQYIANVDVEVKQQFDHVLAGIAQELQTPVLTLAGDDLMNLSLPDGTVHRLSVEQDDDGGIRNTAEMRRLIADHSKASAVAG
jgi:hypothetical protein